MARSTLPLDTRLEMTLYLLESPNRFFGLIKKLTF